jgi:hypothetical protein
MTLWIQRIVARLVLSLVAITSIGLPVASLAAGAGYPLDQFPKAKLDDQAALQNLLNIIGRRDGARSVISIG